MKSPLAQKSKIVLCVLSLAVLFVSPFKANAKKLPVDGKDRF